MEGAGHRGGPLAPELVAGDDGELDRGAAHREELVGRQFRAREGDRLVGQPAVEAAAVVRRPPLLVVDAQRPVHRVEIVVDPAAYGCRNRVGVFTGEPGQTRHRVGDHAGLCRERDHGGAHGERARMDPPGSVRRPVGEDEPGGDPAALLVRGVDGPVRAAVVQRSRLSPATVKSRRLGPLTVMRKCRSPSTSTATLAALACGGQTDTSSAGRPSVSFSTTEACMRSGTGRVCHVPVRVRPPPPAAFARDGPAARMMRSSAAVRGPRWRSRRTEVCPGAARRLDPSSAGPPLAASRPRDERLA